MPGARNLVNLNGVAKDYGSRADARATSRSGVADRDRIGVVGGNGQGKSTLLELIAGAEQPDAGSSHAPAGWRRVLDQSDRLASGRRSARCWSATAPSTSGPATASSAACSTGCSAASRWRASRSGLDTPHRAACPGGERRRIALARAAARPPDLLLLDEPTNHLDVEAIAWLAGHLAARDGAMLVVTHDRWFLDAVCTHTWEVADGARPPVRGRLRGLRARPRRARPQRGRARGPPPAAGAQGARLAAARAAGAHLQAQVPDRGRQRADRRRAAGARPHRAAAVRELAPRQQGDRGRGHLLTATASAA